MKRRIAINGFGRIGRNFLRTVMLDKKALSKLEVVAINIGPADPTHIALMFKYDTLMGTYPGVVHATDHELVIDGVAIKIIAERDPLNAPWKALKIDWVVEASGFFTEREKALLHLQAGAQAVLITAPAQGEDIAIVPGVNCALFNPEEHKIVSLGSCTTNALAPMIKVLHDSFGLMTGFMTTVHAYTNTQELLDVESDDPRRGRAAALNIVPTSTGVTKVIDKIIPGVKGLVHGCSLRVPVAKVSIVDLVFVLKMAVTVDQVNDAFVQAAARGSLHDKLAVSFEPLVSSDYAGSPYSVVIDALSTQAHGTMGKLFGWYDNEWGYSERLKDFLMY